MSIEIEASVSELDLWLHQLAQWLSDPEGEPVAAEPLAEEFLAWLRLSYEILSHTEASRPASSTRS